jgi:hypothetical protein
VAALWLVAAALGISTGVTATDNAASAAGTSGAPATNKVVGTSGRGSGWRGSWPPPAPKPHDPCTGAFQGPPQGSVQKTTSAGPNGSSVVPGQRITVTLTWKPSDFSGNHAFLTEDCVQIGSRPAWQLSQVHLPAPAGGTDTFSYVVPRGGTGGQPICDRGVVAGNFDPQQGWEPGKGGGAGKKDGWVQGGGTSQSGYRTQQGGSGQGQTGNGGSGGFGTEKSAVLCYSILAADAPEAPDALLFPLAALLVIGGAVLITRRRRGIARTRAAAALDPSDPGIG